MHAVTLRRLIVFGVCAVGVSCLYLLPSVARPPHQAPGPQPLDEPTTRPSARTARDASTPLSAPTDPSTSRAAAGTQPETREADVLSPSEPAAAQPSSSGATAFQRAEQADEESPAAVTDLTSAAVTPTQLSLRWPAASDNVGVVGYTVVLDGFEVATTAETSTTIRWFNNDAREHSVQVRALDAAGNLSASSPNLLVAHPTPEPEPSPEPSTAAPKPSPAPKPTPEPTPSAAPSTSAPADSADDRSLEAPSSGSPESSERSDPAGPQTSASAGGR